MHDFERRDRQRVLVAQRAARRAHGGWLGHAAIPLKDVVGSGKSQRTFDLVEIERASTYATEGADLALRLWRVLKPRLVAEGLVSIVALYFSSGVQGRNSMFRTVLFRE